MTQTPISPVSRNSAGLVDAMFDAIDRLNNKEIDPEHARALAHTARTIVSVATLELDYRKLQRDSGMDVLRSLSITDQAK